MFSPTGREVCVTSSVMPTDGEVVLLLAGHVVEHGLDLRGRGVLRGQAVAAAEQLQLASGLGQRGADVLVKRLAESAGLLGAVERGEDLAACGDRAEEVLEGEGTVQADLDQADLLAALAEVVHDLLRALADRAHRHDHALGLGIAEVVEQLVVAARQGGHLGHILLDHGREGVVGRVGGLAVLEEDIVVLAAVADRRMLGVQRAVAEFLQLVPVEHLAEILIVEHVDLLDLVGGAEAVEEVLHGDVALDGGQVRHRAEIHALLHARGSQLRPADLAAGHHVLVVAEDGDGLGRDGTRGHVHDRRQQQARDAVHRRDHQHQALGGGVGRAESARLERALHGGAGAGLGLHFHELDRHAEKVLLPLGGPLVHVVGHGAGRRDGVDRRDFGKGIACVRGGLVAVHGFPEHKNSSLIFSFLYAGVRVHFYAARAERAWRSRPLCPGAASIIPVF